MPAAGISFDRVRVFAGQKQLLEVPQLKLTQQRISVIGPNGGGKSTLLQLVNGLIEPTEGYVNVAGLDTIDDGTAVRQQVGYVFANPAAQLIMPTPVEDVSLSLRAQLSNAAQRRDAAYESLAELGIEDLAERSSHEISAGQQQLVALATVLAHEPRILLLDEPTTLLDRVNSRRFSAVVDTLCADRGIQVLTATHDLNLAAAAQRCLLIAEGAVAAEGNPAEVIAEYMRRSDP